MSEQSDGGRDEARPTVWSWPRRLAGWVQERSSSDRPQLFALAAILIFIGLGTLHAAIVKPLGPIDERAHFSYALALRDGTLPEIDTPMKVDIVGVSKREQRNTIWVANHPPLFHAAEALVIGDVETAADVPQAFFRGRMLSVAITSVALWLVFLCLRELAAPRSKMPVVVIALLATVPHFTHIMALIYTDSLALLTTTCAIYCAILMLKRGLSATYYVGLLFSLVGCLGARVSGLMVAGVTLTALCIAVYQDIEASRARKLGTAAALVSGVLLAIALSSGWFYLRNYDLYGDISGAAFLFEKFDREPRGGFLRALLSRSVWRGFLTPLWRDFGGGVNIHPTTRLVPKYLGIVAMIGFAVAVGLRLRSVTPAQFWSAMFRPTGLSILMLIGLTGLGLISVLVFHSRGGHAYIRYLFHVLWFVAAIPVIGMLRIGSWACSFALTILVLLHLMTLETYVARRCKGHTRDLLMMCPEQVDAALLGFSLCAVSIGLSLVLRYIFMPVER